MNGGHLYTPFVVKNILEPETNNIMQSFDTTFVRSTISAETSEKMRYALESVVARGGGRYAYIDGYRIGGKTGTAQKVENGTYLVNNYIMSFMAVVPANDPQAVLYIAIDNPKNTAMLSSYTTAPVARRILLDIIEALDIPRQEGGIDPVYKWGEDTFSVVPNVIGMTPSEATKALSKFKVEYTGEGDKVVEQSPTAGESVADGSTIRLLLE